MKVSPEMCCAH